MSLAFDVPVKMRDNTFYTDIPLNHGTGRLIVDSGGFGHLLKDSAAKRLGLNRQMLDDVATSGIGGERALDLATYYAPSADGTRGREVQFLTIADDALPDWSDGALGQPLLEPFDDDLDLAAGHLRLVKARGDCHIPASNLGGSVYAVDLIRIGDEHAAVVNVSIDGHSLRAELDTGAAISTLDSNAARQIGLPVSDMMRNTKSYLSGIGPRRSRAVFGQLQLPISIGALNIGNLPVAVSEQPLGDGIDMLLGYDFFTTVHAWLSHSSRSLLMHYPPLPTRTGAPAAR